jgi:SARP family transcriptional regulator, regulator of embCAB operon
MASGGVQLQICDTIAVEIAGTRREHDLPGQQGRHLLAFLVLNRAESLTRDAIIEALRGDAPPIACATSLNALVSKLRRVLACRAENGLLRLDTPPDTWVDLEAARDAIHRAESAIAQRDWARAWGAAQTALFTARRGFLPWDDAPWIDAVRAELSLLHQRSLGAYARAALGIGRTELATAERASRELVSRAPLRESGYRLLMSAHAAQGNTAEALQVHDELRVLLRNELGVAPSAPTRALHTELLQAST